MIESLSKGKNDGKLPKIKKDQKKTGNNKEESKKKKAKEKRKKVIQPPKVQLTEKLSKNSIFGAVSRTTRSKILDPEKVAPPIGHYKPNYGLVHSKTKADLKFKPLKVSQSIPQKLDKESEGEFHQIREMLKETIDFTPNSSQENIGRNIHERHNNQKEIRSLSPRWDTNKSMVNFSKQTNRMDITSTCLSPHEARFELPKLPDIKNDSKRRKITCDIKIDRYSPRKALFDTSRSSFDLSIEPNKDYILKSSPRGIPFSKHSNKGMKLSNFARIKPLKPIIDNNNLHVIKDQDSEMIEELLKSMKQK